MRRLEEYVVGILSHLKNDQRVLMWDIYNGKLTCHLVELQYCYLHFAEPGREGLETKSLRLLQLAWKWAHSVRPSQPLTSPMDGSVGEQNIRFNEIMSDIITFHE